MARCEYYELSPPRAKAGSGSRPRQTAAALTVSQLRALQALLASPSSVRAGAERWFRAFALTRASGGEAVLDFVGLRATLRRLHEAVGVPWASDGDIRAALSRFGGAGGDGASDGGGALALSGFHELFFRMLLGCKKKFQQQPVHVQLFAGGEGCCHLLDRCSVVRRLGSLTEDTSLLQDRVSRKRYILRTLGKNKVAVPPRHLESRLELLKCARAPHVQQLAGWSEDYWNVYLTLEACAASPLPAVLDKGLSAQWRPSEPWISMLARQVLRALAYCHGHQLFHGDLAASAVLLRSSPDPLARPCVLLSEVGLRGVIREEERSAGPPRPPGPGGDLLRLGLLLALLLAGPTGPAGVSAGLLLPAALRRRAGEPAGQAGVRSPCRGMSCSPDGRDLVHMLLGGGEEEPRPDAQQALNHSWCSGRRAAATDAHCAPLRARAARLAEALRRARQAEELAQRVVRQMRTCGPRCANCEVGAGGSLHVAGGADAAGAGLAAKLRRLGLQAEAARSAAQELDEAVGEPASRLRLLDACASLFNERLEQALWARLRGRTCGLVEGAVDAREVAGALLGGELADAGVPAMEGGDVQRLLESLDSTGTGCIMLEDLSSSLLLQSAHADPCWRSSPLADGLCLQDLSSSLARRRLPWLDVDSPPRGV